MQEGMASNVLGSIVLQGIHGDRRVLDANFFILYRADINTGSLESTKNQTS
jgi:hypothetical protein